jgi:DNA replication protein DnaC
MTEEAVTPSDLKRLDVQLDALHLSHVRGHYQAFATTAAQKQLSHLAYLAELIEGEAARRESRAIERRIKNARFPVLKTMEDFEWNWPKKINRPQIQNLFRLAFIADNTNVVFISTVGLGKTHCAIALGHAACMGGHSVLFTTAVDIINTLAAAQSTGRLKREIARYLKPTLLIIDELGYLPIDKLGADLLFQIISQRYECAPMVITATVPTGTGRRSSTTTARSPQPSSTASSTTSIPSSSKARASAPDPRSPSNRMARKHRTEQEHELTVSDEAAAYLADTLMQLALEFENTHYAQIRHHTKQWRPSPTWTRGSSISFANPRLAHPAERPRALPLPPTSSVRPRRRLFPRPDRGSPRPSRADAVKTGRRAKTCRSLARLKAEPLRRRARRHDPCARANHPLRIGLNVQFQTVGFRPCLRRC